MFLRIKIICNKRRKNDLSKVFYYYSIYFFKSKGFSGIFLLLRAGKEGKKAKRRPSPAKNGARCEKTEKREYHRDG